MGTVLKSPKKINRVKLSRAKRREVLSDRFEGLDGPIDSQHLLISLLLPPAVKAFLEQVEQEVTELCGVKGRHQRDRVNYRWGVQPGSIILGTQHVALERPRVRTRCGHEVELNSYREFQDPKLFRQVVFDQGLKRVSQRDYAKGLPQIAASFGIKKSSISRQWIKATAKQLDELMSRDLSQFQLGAIFIDGKRFRDLGVIVALGVALDGKKHILGIYQASSEDHGSCLELLSNLESRGLPPRHLVFVVDGGSGLNKALDMKYYCNDKDRRTAVRIRCYVHKWRNLEKALGGSADEIKGLFWGIRDAANRHEAEKLSARLEAILRQYNVSAYRSFLEAKNDLLVIHDLQLPHKQKRFFSTTNPIESLNSLLEEDLRRVKHWRNSAQFQRWLATYCLANEKRMRRVTGHKNLPALWTRIHILTSQNNIDLQQEIG